MKTLLHTDPEYPVLLRELPDAPKKLYIRGELDPGELCIAIVGTRHPNVRGLETAYRFAFELAQQGYVIVSGLAFGIDTAAHEGALAASKDGGKTVAVLGTGIENITPRSNCTLAEKIVQCGGAIISEYEPARPGAKYNFPERNRIIAGLSVATIIIEAPQKSGALITADFALDYNREIFAVPGSIYSENSTGTNTLIKNGSAQLVTSTKDVINFLTLSLHAAPLQSSSPPPML